MKMQLMNVQKQHMEHQDEYESAAINVLRSGLYIGGEEVTNFEREFADYCGAKFGISCGNGTDALVLALKALDIGPGDEVITVSWTFFATAESIAAVGATPVFIDVSESTYCMNPDLIEKAITPKTKAVLPVHFYGQACEMDRIRKICKDNNLFLITDCAQCAGTRYKGERRNVLGDVSCFSFFPTKNLGCDGDGGMVLTDNEDVAKAVRSLKVHGSGSDGLSFLKKKFEKNNIPFPNNIPIGDSKYYNYLIGYNSRLDAIQAAILRKKLNYLENFIDRRRANANFYNESLKGTEYITPIESADSYHSYYIYALRHDNAHAIMEKLAKKGIPSGVYYPIPLHLQGAFAYLGYKEGDLPITEKLSKTTFAIPVYPELTIEERKDIVTALLEALK